MLKAGFEPTPQLVCASYTILTNQVLYQTELLPDMAGVEGFEPSHAGVMAIGSGTDPPSACTSRALPLDDPMKSCALPLGDTPILILYCSFELKELYHMF